MESTQPILMSYLFQGDVIDEGASGFVLADFNKAWDESEGEKRKQWELQVNSSSFLALKG